MSPLQTRGPYKQEPLHYIQAKGLQYSQLRAPTGQGPLQTKNPYMIYMQGRKGLIQTRGHYKQEHLHYIQAKDPIQACRETRAHADREALQKVVPTEKWPFQIREPYRQRALTYKRPLQTRGPYRQGALTYKEFIQTRGLYNKGPL